MSRSARMLVSIAVVLLGAVVLLYAFQETSLPTRLIVGVSLALIAAWFVYSLWVDRRYARLLEDEVANQTRSLMSSLSATASTERNLRLLMEAVPDAITASLPEAPRSAFGWLAGTAMRIARENLGAAFDGELRRFEVPFRRPDGGEGTANVLLAPVREGGRIPKVLALVRDI